MGKGFLETLGIEISKVEGDEVAPTPQNPTVSAPVAHIGPVVIASLVPGREGTGQTPVAHAPVAAPAVSGQGPSERTLKLVDSVRQLIPATNATLLLENAMKSLEAYIPDKESLQQAAMKTLAGQGISASSVQQALKEVGTIIDKSMDGYLQEAEGVRMQDVDGKRSEAQTLRGKTASIDEQIAALVADKAAIGHQADELDQQAAARESELTLFRNEVEAARALARSQFSV